MTEPTSYQMLAQFVRAVPECQLRIKPFEKVLKVQITDEQASILIETYEVDERHREYRITAAGKRCISYYKKGTAWVKVADMTVWDEDFVPTDVVKFGRRNTPEVYADRRDWEAACARPGTASSPMDSFERTLDAYSTPKMERHWFGPLIDKARKN